MPQNKKSRRAYQGTPKSSTSFKRNKRTFSQKRKNSSRSSSSKKSSQPSPKWRTLNNSWSSTSKQSNQTNQTERGEKAKLQTQTCRFWNQSRCKHFENCEYAHFHMKFFHKTLNLKTKGKASLINQQYQEEIKSGKVLLETKQLKFITWQQVEQYSKNMLPEVIEQSISIATLNKNAERDYIKQYKTLMQQDDDPLKRIDHKIKAFLNNRDQLIKNDIKSDAAKKLISDKTSQQQQDLQNKSQQQNPMDVEEEAKNNQNQNQQLKKEKYKSSQKKTQNKKQNKQQQEQKQSKNKTSQQKEEKNNDKKTDKLKIEENKYKSIIKQLDTEYLNKLAIQAQRDNKYPLDNQHSLISQDIIINQAWENKLVQLITDQQFFIQQLYEQQKIRSFQLRKKIKYAIFINQHMLELINDNFSKKQFEIIETVYHNIGILILNPFFKILKSQGIIPDNDKLDPEGLSKFLYIQQQGNEITKLNTDPNQEIIVIFGLNQNGIKTFQQ